MSKLPYTVGHCGYLASHVRAIPAYDGRPPVLRDTLLRVVRITGRGTQRAPHDVVVTIDGTHEWHLDPGDFAAAP